MNDKNKITKFNKLEEEAHELFDRALQSCTDEEKTKALNRILKSVEVAGDINDDKDRTKVLEAMADFAGDVVQCFPLKKSGLPTDKIVDNVRKSLDTLTTPEGFL
jgi:hypothetical protein